MSLEHKFVPMSEANTWRLRTTATLPFQLHESVGLNVGRIETLCQIAGFRYLKIQNDPNGETSQAVPLVVGVGRDGQAVASRAAVKNVPTYQFDSSQVFDVRWPMKQARWKDSTISLNTEEMKQRILLSDERVTDSNEWGKQIDKALKGAAMKGGVRHLVSGLDRFEKIMTPFFYALIFSNDLVTIAKGESPEAIPISATSIVITGTLMTGLYSLRYGVEKPGGGRRVSLFYGPELDRAIALAVFTYTSKLAKGIPGDK